MWILPHMRLSLYFWIWICVLLSTYLAASSWSLFYYCYFVEHLSRYLFIWLYQCHILYLSHCTHKILVFISRLMHCALDSNLTQSDTQKKVWRKAWFCCKIDCIWHIFKLRCCALCMLMICLVDSLWNTFVLVSFSLHITKEGKNLMPWVSVCIQT